MVFSSSYRIQVVALASLLFVLPVVVHGWGIDGHYTVCNIAQSRLSETAAAVKELLPEYAKNDLGSLCSWADDVKKLGYTWSKLLHFVNTPYQVCNYEYTRDCKEHRTGTEGICVVAAIHNYTTQLRSYGNANTMYNLTEALLFLSHFVGDIHQPLHDGFVSDSGGNSILINWYKKATNLHRAWDDNIIDDARERFYDNKVQGFIEAIQTSITTEWASSVKEWESCDKIACPDIYASDGIRAACAWSYKDVGGGPVRGGSTLGDAYFESRIPIVYQQLAKGGINLASILNKLLVPMTNVY